MSSAKSKNAPRAKRPSKTPSEIAPGVYVGNWDDAVKFQGARFCVLDEEPEGMPPSQHIAIYSEKVDRADRKNLDRLAKEMKSARDRGMPVLVFCGHGIYRSPFGGAWYLHRSEGISLESAYARVREARPKAHRGLDWIGNLAELTGL
ncbi:MAG: dual specificity protein phosphatase family protein [Euryarchaeota archaeon]|nr:dual specificity protein phosphatase family protein [Euryarchaeota archaeon]MDE1880038.1 dual specificity protein phosphatase family protein [Euryarchaeota archaeon]MDE2046133.1 dual specificity protein phosphatase family protein [Thermoplasmata archaeon]